jgi:hypothetical protein
MTLCPVAGVGEGHQRQGGPSHLEDARAAASSVNFRSPRQKDVSNNIGTKRSRRMKQEQLKVNRNILRSGIDRRTLLSALGLLPALSAPPRVCLRIGSDRFERHIALVE